MRILIVDDDRAHGESLCDLLNSRGHEAYFASSWPEAEWLLGLFRFELAILDYDMPGVTGPQLARQLREVDPHLHSALMSARELDERRRQEAGPLPFIPKPIRVEDLLDLISEITAPRSSHAVTVRLSFPLLPRPGRNLDRDA